MKKLLGLVAIVALLLRLGSCGDSDSEPKPKIIDVYLGGHYLNPDVGVSGTYQAAYWKNGELNTISQSTGYVQFVAVSKDGKDLYAFGRTDDDTAFKTIWKNGVATNMFSSITEGNFYDMEVYQGDVYVVGYESVSGISRACVWKNGVQQFLDDALLEGGAAEAIVVGNDLYILGWNDDAGGTKLVYWKNGVKTIVTPNATDQWAFSMAVSGNNVYVLGELDSEYGVWKNGVFTPLQGEDPEFWYYPGSLIVKGSDVYVFGEDYTAVDDKGHACYWKNGVRTIVDNTSDYSTIISAVSTSKGIYAVGYQDLEGSNWNSVVWHDWEIIEPIFSSSARNAYTESIAVAEY
jgi:hypothetical protein